MSDLDRINGIAGQYARLLTHAGVSCVVTLSRENATGLSTRMAQINAEKKLVSRSPGELVVRGWISEARALLEKFESDSDSGGSLREGL